MGFISSFKKAISPDNDEYDEGYDFEDEYEDEEVEEPVQKQSYSQPAQNNAQNTSNVGKGFALKVVKPERYDNETAQKIANYLMVGSSVVVNLENSNKESARRLIDFLSGVAYALNGSVSRVAANTFIVTPAAISVSAEQLVEVKKQQEDDMII